MVLTGSLNSGLRIRKVSSDSLSQSVTLSLTTHISRAGGRLLMLRECVKSAGYQLVSGHLCPGFAGSARHPLELVLGRQLHFASGCWLLSLELALARGDMCYGDEKPEGGDGPLTSGAADSTRKDLPEARTPGQTSPPCSMWA